MSKFKNGLTVDRDIEDPMRRPRPVSQEGYYYPEEHYDKNSLHPNSRRQPMRQYGSSASLEVHQERNRQQWEQEFFKTPPSSRNTQAMQSSSHNVDPSVYYQQPSGQASQSFANNHYLPSQNNVNSRGSPRSVPNTNHPSNSFNSRTINTYNTHNTHLQTNQPSYHPNSQGYPNPLYIPPSHIPPSHIPPSHIPPSYIPPSHTPNSAPQRPIRKNSHETFSRRPSSQESLADPFLPPSSNSRGPEPYQNLQLPPRHNDQSQQQQQQQQYYSPKNQNKAKEAPVVDKNKSQQLGLPDPVSVEDYVSQAIKYHEDNQLKKSTEYLRIATEKGSAVGMVLYGIALRHGWGCNANAEAAFKYLQKAADSAMSILNSINKTVSMSSFRGELVLAIYELGVCFRHGWGVPKSKATAAYYFEISANLGDPDAQNDIAHCYYKGEGVKKDMKKAAKYYRMADAQGHGTMGNSWIFKDKYNNDEK